jgi:L-ascorbate metabolism protein UlaG (beta-lactamase superfamily)
MKVTYYGHSCFQLEVNSKKLLFDPFITPNPLAAGIAIEDIQVDYIFLTHGHIDHVADAVAIAKQSGALVVSNFEIIKWLEKQGVENTQAMNIGGEIKFDFGTIRMTYAVHSSSLPDGSYGGTAAGFLLSSSAGNVYYSGDTALTHDMQLLPHYAAKVDIALLPIGDCYTMGASDAVIAARWVHAVKVIGLHYDTFPAIKINHEEVLAIFQAADVHLLLLAPGETYAG